MAAVTASLRQQQHSPTPSPRRSFGGGSRPTSYAGGREGGKPRESMGGVGGASNVGGGSSVDDKVVQLAVKLLGSFLAASGEAHGLAPDVSPQGAEGDSVAPALPTPTAATTNATAAGTTGAAGGEQGAFCVVRGGGGEVQEAVVQRLSDWWQQGLGLLLPVSTAHVSDMVRSAAVSVSADLPRRVFEQLPQDLQRKVVEVAVQVATRDSAAAVRAAGCKALGAVCAFPAVMGDASLSGGVLGALSAAMGDGVLSVRIASCWGLACMCEGLRALLSSHPAPGPSAAPVSGGGSCAEAAPPLSPHHLAHLARLAQCVVAAVSGGDADKAKVNGLQALGALLGCLSPAWAQAAGIDLDG